MTTIKAHIIVPTVQFGNITYEVEGTPEEINAQADYLLQLRRNGDGLDTKSIDVFVENMILENKKNNVETYYSMSKDQQYWMQVLKRALKRIKNRT